jgi:plastocyanin
VAAGSVLVLNTACGLTFTVTIDDTGYNPDQVRTSDQSDSVKWANNGTTNHSATSLGTGAFFDTGEIAMGSSSSAFSFKDAGTFPYFDNDNPDARGRIVVPVYVPQDAAKGSKITVIWAGSPSIGSYTIPAGFHADVQVVLPHGHRWINWKMNQTGSQTYASTTVTRHGLYFFRARYVKDGPPKVKSWWTPKEICNVT